ncbi:MAG: DUF1566 domain-containing protein [Deltaproteobacteria bacterium]|nr:DUF1566 domain-containing protein [Deltaproteobacteria bacterium]
MKKFTLLVLGLTIVCLSLAFTCFAADKPKEIGKEEHWVAYDDGTVLDTKTGLMWASESSKPMKWIDAKAYIDNYKGSGYTDWRFPTTVELESLFDPWLTPATSKTGAVMGTFYLTKYIKLQAKAPWTAEKKSRDETGNTRRVFDFERGASFFAVKTGTINSAALPVRDTKK